MRILIIEDDRESADYLVKAFREVGYVADLAGDVREAINAARSDNKNSVLMRVKSGGSSRFVAVPLAKG